MMDLPVEGAAIVGRGNRRARDRRRHQYTTAAHALPAIAAAAEATKEAATQAAATSAATAASQNSRAHAFSTLVLCEWPTRSVVVRGRL